MGLHGKLVAAIEFKAGGDVFDFHDLLKQNPNKFSEASPDKLHSCDLFEGEFGKVGTIIDWTYTHDGKQQRIKEVIEVIDDEKKFIQYKAVEGNLLELYNSFVMTSHVETKGDIDLVTWTFEYEKLNEDVEHPFSLLSYFIDLTKEIAAHHLIT